MGCHTWAWVNIPITHEELLVQAGRGMTKLRQFVAKHRNKKGNNPREWDDYLAKNERKLADGKFADLVDLMGQVDHRHLDCYAGKLYEECNNYNTRLHGKERYTYVDTPLQEDDDPTVWRPRTRVTNEEVYWCHDPFRVSGYPGKRLFSLRQTLNYRDKLLREKPDYISWHPESLALVEEFWRCYPDGMLTFG